MQIKHTGLLITNPKELNKKNKGQPLTISCANTWQSTNFKTNQNKNISFGASFFDLSKIKDLLFEDSTLEPNKTINTAQAKKIIAKELEKEKVYCKPGHLTELVGCKDKLTPEKAQILAKLYIIQLKTEGNYIRPYSEIHNEMRFFCEKDDKVNTKLFEKMYELQKHELMYKDYTRSHNIRVLTLNCKDKNGYHPEVIDLYESKYLREDLLKLIKKQGQINIPLIELIKILDENKVELCFPDIIRAAYNYSQKPDLYAINSIKEKVKKYGDDIDKIIKYIKFSKDKKGNYQQENENLLLEALETKNNSKIYFSLNDLWKYSLDETKKQISREKLSINIEALKLFTNDNSGLVSSYLKMINGNPDRLDACKKLKNTLINPNRHNVLEILTYCLLDNKQSQINNEIIKFIKKVVNKYKLEPPDLASLLDLVKKDTTINRKYYELITQVQNESGIEMPVVLELAKIYLKTYENSPNLQNKFGEYVNAYKMLVEKHYKNYVLSQRTDEEIKAKYGSEENIKINYKHLDGSNFKTIMSYMLAKTLEEDGMNQLKLSIIDKIPYHMDLENAHNALKCFNGLIGKDFINFLKILALAKENKQTLRDGVEDLTDSDIEEEFIEIADVLAAQYQKLGEKLFTHAFNLKFDNFLSFIENAQFIRDYWDEKLLPKIFPEQTEEYISAQKEVSKLKKLLSNKIKPEQKELQKQHKGQIENLKKEISVLKSYLKENPQDENTRKSILDKNEKVKELTKEVQKYYKNATLKNIIEKINENQKLIAKYDNEKINDLNEVIKHIKTLAVIVENFPEEDVIQYIEMMGKKDAQSKKELRAFIHNKIFEKMDIEYTDTLAKYLDFSKSKYLTNLMQEDDEDFWSSFKWLCQVLDNKYAKNVKEILDNVESNINTKKMFSWLNIDYDKWTTVDKNSYVKVDVITDVEKSKQATIKNLEEDLNSELWNDIPPQESEKIFTAITKAGFELKNNEEATYDVDGYADGTQIVKRLYKNGSPISFEDTNKVINAIKSVMNRENFWNESLDETEERTLEDIAKGTLLTHILKMRANEFQNATAMLDNETITLEVHKSDMNYIVHSLFLGNHASCCTAVGGGCNSWSAPVYVTHKCISSIEVMDGKNFVGNTMCFIADVDGELSLVLDNIELNTKYQYNDKIKDAIIEYAKKLCQEIGRPDLKIYAGPNRHKVNLEEYEFKKHKMHIKGYSGEEVLIDSIGSIKISPDTKPSDVKLYKIR